MTTEERRAALEAIAAEVRVCERCPLARGRTHAVPGEGSPDTEVVFVGEGPGQNEDRQGRPFVGAAGGLLEQLLTMVGWRREDAFITNVVKCRPPGNRDPEPAEIAACAPYLQRQLEALDPAMVVTLGRFSLQAFMPGARIGQVHGTARPAPPDPGARGAVAYAMYHPAAALRQPALVTTLQRDMAAIPETLIRTRAERAAQAGLAVPIRAHEEADRPAGLADSGADRPPGMADAGADPVLAEAGLAHGPAALLTMADASPAPVSDDQLGLF